VEEIRNYEKCSIKWVHISYYSPNIKRLLRLEGDMEGAYTRIREMG
jgi:hypothetical protein